MLALVLAWRFKGLSNSSSHSRPSRLVTRASRRAGGPSRAAFGFKVGVARILKGHFWMELQRGCFVCTNKASVYTKGTLYSTCTSSVFRGDLTSWDNKPDFGTIPGPDRGIWDSLVSSLRVHEHLALFISG